MNAICRLFGHRPSEDAVWNDGFFFGRCTRCACELVRAKGRWSAVPRGFRIVWREPSASHIDWARWRHGAFQPEAPPLADASDLKVVPTAAERRDPASPGHPGIPGGQRRGDREPGTRDRASNA